MPDVFGMGGGAYGAGRDAADGCARGYVAGHHGARAYTCSAADLDIVDYARAGTDIYAVSYQGGTVNVGAYRCELAEIDVVAYHGSGIDYRAEAVLDVEAVTDACAGRDKQPVALVAVEHHFGQRIEPAFVLRQAEPERKTYRGARHAAEPDA